MHFPPPSSEKTKNSRLPVEGGRSSGLIPTPPPAGAKLPVRSLEWVGISLSEDGCPHPHRSKTKAPALPRGGSPPPHNIQARGKDRDLLPSYTLPRVGQGAAASSTHLHIHSPRPYWAGRTDVAPSLSDRQTASLFLSRVRGTYHPPTWGWGQENSPPPAAIISGTKTSPSPSRVRASQTLKGADGVRNPLKKQQAPPSPSQPGNADPLVLPALHLRKPGRNLGERPRLTPPPAPFYRPPPRPPPLEAARPAPEVGQTSSDWQETAPPLGGVPLRRRCNPALRTAYRDSWLHPFSSHPPSRLSVALDSRPLPGGEGSRPSKPSDELS